MFEHARNAFFLDFRDPQQHSYQIMLRVSIRKLKDSDMQRAFRLVIDSCNTLNRKNNREVRKIRVTAPDPFMMHLRNTDPDGCFGAFEGDRMIGITMALIREHQWFLGYLFMIPGRWSRGVGRRLLRRALKTADPQQTSLYSLCTFSYNPQAVALYSSFGMTPQDPLIAMTWNKKKDKALRLGRSDRKLTAKVIDSYEDIAFINKLDRKNRAIARPEEHKFFIDHDKTKLTCFYEGKKPKGYAVLYSDGFVAPVSAVDPQYLQVIVHDCIRRQLDAGCEGTALICVGSNSNMMEYLLKVGFRVRETFLLLSNKPFGNPDCYLPANMAIY